MNSFIDVINKNAVEFNNSPLLRYRNTQLTYSEVVDKAYCLTSALRKLNIQKDDSVALYLPNIPEFVIAYVACLKSNCNVVPINLSFRKHEIKSIVDNLKIKAFIYWDRFEDKLKAVFDEVVEVPSLIAFGVNTNNNCQEFYSLIENSTPDDKEIVPDSNDDSVVVFSSGATSFPKGAVFSHEGLLKIANEYVSKFRFTSEDKILGALPLYHYLGHFSILAASMVAGSEMILHTRFKPDEIINSISRSGVTVIIGTPQMFRAMANEENIPQDALKNIRIGIIGGGKPDKTLISDFKEKFDTPLFQIYSCAESPSIVSCFVLQSDEDINILGKPEDFVSVRLRGADGEDVGEPEMPGEIIIKSFFNMRRYVNSMQSNKETQSCEWVFPGDLFAWTDNGELKYLGHKKDLIQKGNYPVIASEIESVIENHEVVQECVVIGVHNKEYIQDLKAIVVKESEKEISSLELKEYCSSRGLPKYKIPRQIEFVESLPKTIGGNVIKRFLK